MNKYHVLLLMALVAQLPAPIRAGNATPDHHHTLQLPKKPKPLEKAPTSVFIIGTLIKENASFLGLSLGSVAAMAAGWYLLHKYHAKPATPQPNPVLTPTPPAAPEPVVSAPHQDAQEQFQVIPLDTKNDVPANLHIIQYVWILMLIVKIYLGT